MYPGDVTRESIRMRISLVILLVAVGVACKKVNRDKLDEVMSENLVSDRAMNTMAGGGEFEFEGDLKYPVYVHFVHEGGANDYRFFETKNKDSDPLDYSAYKEVKNVPTQGLYNGFMLALKLEESHDRWGILTYQLGDSLRVSDPIEIKAIDRKTQTLGNFLEVDEDGLTPTFSWSDGSFQESDSFLFVIADENDDAICAGELNGNAWTFYDELSLTTDLIGSPMPVLEEGKTYSFTIFGISENGWMNIKVTKSFNT